jgi:hypothetical protein
MDELSGQLLDLTEVLGPQGRRLGDQLHQAPTWRQQLALVDRFLRRRLNGGPRPAAEVAWAWQRLVATGGAVPIGQLADEVGWSHKHLITRFRTRSGCGPRPPPAWSASNLSWVAWTSASGWTGGRPHARPATPTRPTSSATSTSSPAPPQPSTWPGHTRPIPTASNRSNPFKTP